MSMGFIAWFEIPATDFEKAVTFYSQVFNLEIKRVEFGSIPHGIIDPGNQGGPAGAIVQVDKAPGPNAGPVLYFKVYEMHETLLKIKSLGGTILKEKTIIKNSTVNGKSIIPKTLIDGAQGYFSIFKDPEGNRMALYSNS